MKRTLRVILIFALFLPVLSCLPGQKRLGGKISAKKESVSRKSSKGSPIGKSIEVAEKIDRPNVFKCDGYPPPDSQQANEFLSRVLEGLRQRGLASD